MNIGKLGVWLSQEMLSAADAAAQARRIEAWGYGALWQPEAVGRNVLVHAGLLLANTTSLVVATGIANIYARDPMACAAAQKTLAEASGGRFLLGLGVSHIPLVEGVRRHDYGKPVSTMRDYLDRQWPPRCTWRPAPAEKPPTVIAALGPKMLALSAEPADGAHPYNVTPEHTERARVILGPGKLLCAEQMVLLETDPAKARAAARRTLGHLSAAAQLRQQLVHPGLHPRRRGQRRLGPAGRRHGRLGRRGRDPRAHPGPLGRRRRPRLHPAAERTDRTRWPPPTNASWNCSPRRGTNVCASGTMASLSTPRERCLGPRTFGRHAAGPSTTGRQRPSTTWRRRLAKPSGGVQTVAVIVEIVYGKWCSEGLDAHQLRTSCNETLGRAEAGAELHPPIHRHSPCL